MSVLDPGYHALLESLYLGKVPKIVSTQAEPRFRAESLRRRLQVAASTWDAFPRASFYANALLGDECLEGVCRELIRFSATSEGSLLTRVEAAARKWAAQVEDPRIRALFEYDALVLRGLPYLGPVREQVRAAADLPEVFALATFDYDMVVFGQHVDVLYRSHAPPTLVREYVPIRRRQSVVVYESAGSSGQRIVVRDVTKLLEAARG